MIRLSKSCIGDAEKAAVQGVLDREFLGMGDEVRQFEEALAEFFGRPVCCVVNGTAALQLALQACGIGPGDEVLVPSLTYVASFQAISATGATPVACDIDPESLMVDPDDAGQRLTDKTRAIMPVHYSGGVEGIDAIYEFAKTNSLRVVEDAAHAFGSQHRGKRVGGFGDVACFSFDGIKNITSGEGGCIVSDDVAVLKKIQDARLLGVEKDTDKRYSGQRSWEFEVTGQGWRYHMSNIMAAIGLEQLKRFPDLSEKRKLLARLYDQKFNSHSRVRPLPRDYDTIVPHIYVVRLKDVADRSALQKKLLAKGIQVGIHYMPNHSLSFYKEEDRPALPVTEAVYPELLTLPLHPDLSETDIETICSELDTALID